MTATSEEVLPERPCPSWNNATCYSIILASVLGPEMAFLRLFLPFLLNVSRIPNCIHFVFYLRRFSLSRPRDPATPGYLLIFTSRYRPVIPVSAGFGPAIVADRDRIAGRPRNNFRFAFASYPFRSDLRRRVSKKTDVIPSSDAFILIILIIIGFYLETKTGREEARERMVKYLRSARTEKWSADPIKYLGGANRGPGRIPFGTCKEGRENSSRTARVVGNTYREQWK